MRFACVRPGGDDLGIDVWLGARLFHAYLMHVWPSNLGAGIEKDSCKQVTSAASPTATPTAPFSRSMAFEPRQSRRLWLALVVHQSGSRLARKTRSSTSASASLICTRPHSCVEPVEVWTSKTKIPKHMHYVRDVCSRHLALGEEGGEAQQVSSDVGQGTV